MKTKLQCEICENIFYKYPSYLKNRPGRFCSIECRIEWKRREWVEHNPMVDIDNSGQNNPMFGKRPWNYRVQGTPRKDGYIRKTVNGKRVLKHRLIAEQLIGRSLNLDEIVHHIDGDNQNNSPDNLQILTQADHLRLHMRQWDGERGTKWRCGEDRNTISTKKVG